MAGPGLGQNVQVTGRWRLHYHACCGYHTEAGGTAINMQPNTIHITDLFRQFAVVQQLRLRNHRRSAEHQLKEVLEHLLSRYCLKKDVSALRQALLDPYFPLGMMLRTTFADVVGMRFFINKNRPDLEPKLTEELLQWATVFLRIRRDIQTLLNPETITCIPLDDRRHPLPSGQWCTLCGVCCQIGGVPPNPADNVQYPEHWFPFLAGEAIENQQLCPFLFQYFGTSRFFCAIHNIKPLTCRQFEQKDCCRRLDEGDLHARPAPARRI